jgi:hypothetical protein
VIGAFDLQTVQVRIDAMCRIASAAVGTTIERFVRIVFINRRTRRRAAQFENIDLSLDGKRMFAVDHRSTLSNPALVNALSKKSFSKVN